MRHAAMVSRVIMDGGEGGGGGLVTPGGSPQRRHSFRARHAPASPRPSVRKCPSTTNLGSSPPAARHKKAVVAHKGGGGGDSAVPLGESEELMAPADRTRRLYSHDSTPAAAAAAGSCLSLAEHSEHGESTATPRGGQPGAAAPRRRRRRRRWRRFMRSRGCRRGVALLGSCRRNISVSLGVTMAAAAAALGFLLFTVVGAYASAGGFVAAQCEAVSLSHVHRTETCWCGLWCNNTFPCIEIVVQYADMNGRIITGFLRQNENNLQTLCAFVPECKNSTAENRDQVAHYAARYGAGRYPCLYSPAVHGQVIRERRFQTEHVVHSVVWPIVIFAVAAVLLALSFRIDAFVQRFEDEEVLV